MNQDDTSFSFTKHICFHWNWKDHKLEFCFDSSVKKNPFMFLNLLCYFMPLCFLLAVTTARGMPLRGFGCFCLYHVNITQRGATRVVLLMCHIWKYRPHEWIQLCCNREIKTTALRLWSYDHFDKAVCPAHRSRLVLFRVGSKYMY